MVLNAVMPMPAMVPPAIKVRRSIVNIINGMYYKKVKLWLARYMFIIQFENSKFNVV